MAEADGTVTLDLVGARLLAMNAELRDLQQRVPDWKPASERLKHAFPALEARFPALRDASASRKSA